MHFHLLFESEWKSRLLFCIFVGINRLLILAHSRISPCKSSLKTHTKEKWTDKFCESNAKMNSCHRNNCIRTKKFAKLQILQQKKKQKKHIQTIHICISRNSECSECWISSIELTWERVKSFKLEIFRRARKKERRWSNFISYALFIQHTLGSVFVSLSLPLFFHDFLIPLFREIDSTLTIVVGFFPLLSPYSIISCAISATYMNFKWHLSFSLPFDKSPFAFIYRLCNCEHFEMVENRS